VSSVEGMDALIRRLNAIGDTAADMRALQLATISEAQRNVHRVTGNLQRSILPGPVTDDSAIVRAVQPYAAAEEFGRRAVTIRPRKAKVLAWGGPRRLTGRLRSGGQATHFAMVVHQPARQGHPYLIPAARKSIGMLQELIVKRWNSAG